LPLEAPEYGAPEQPLASHRVLIVSDSEDLRESIREYLERWGMLGIPEASGLEALDHLQQAAPSGDGARAVILSRSSSDIGAREFLELQSANPAIKDVPVLMLRDPGVPLESGTLPACVRAEVSKPIRSSELYDALTRLFAPGPRASSAPPSSAGRETAGLRILIVDDNEINRFVALRQVERLGYEGVTACNGEEAVQAVAGGDFAAVLMDCQMPVMDGYEATREIRRREAGQRHMPILALTAHALAKERDKCLRAGMDGYLTKPARLDVLRSVLARWTLPQRSGKSGTLQAVSQPPDVVLEPLPTEPDTSPEQISAAPVLADEERPARLLELFLIRTPPLLEALALAIESANADDVRAHAHKLKGSCMAVGARRMALIAEQIQHAAERADSNAAASPLPLLIEQWSEVSELLQKEQQKERQAALAGSAQSN
jgi:CheY-like chemotaxis protein